MYRNSSFSGVYIWNSVVFLPHFVTFIIMLCLFLFTLFNKPARVVHPITKAFIEIQYCLPHHTVNWYCPRCHNRKAHTQCLDSCSSLSCTDHKSHFQQLPPHKHNDPSRDHSLQYTQVDQYRHMLS